MDRMSSLQIWLAGALLAWVMLLANTASAQEEVASAVRRYKAYEASTGYYEEYEVLPRHQLQTRSFPLQPHSCFGEKSQPSGGLPSGYQIL